MPVKRKRQRGSSDQPTADVEHSDAEPQHADSDPPSEDEAPQKKPRKQRQQRQNFGTVRKTYKRRASKVQGLTVAEAEAHLGSVGKRLIEAVTEAADVQQLKERAGALPVRHLNDKQALLARHRQQFPHWHWQLREGFSVLLHGYGSKRQLLEAFGREQLTDGGVVVAAGHHPGLTARKLLHLVVQKATGRPTSGRGPTELLAALAAAGGTGAPLYVLLHNIDGPGLRSLADQALLSEMAACPGVHLAATIDHCSAPLLWDRQAAARFNWVWHDATTFAPYSAETLDVPPVLSGGMQAAGRRAAGAVLRSMVPRSRAVFAVLAEQQADDPEAEGVALPHLYRLCRERFLVATEAALRGHLVEFKDHDLLRTRVSAEGQEVMYIPLEPEAVRKLLEQLEELD